MSLKDEIIQDIDNVFFDINDFADYHRLAGKEILVVEDNDSVAEKSYMLGIENASYVLYFKTKDYKMKQRNGMIINYDGKECIIESYTENKGVTCLVLSQNR